MNRFETLRYQQERARLQATLREIRFIRRRLGSMEKTIAALLADDQASPGGRCGLAEPDGELTESEERQVTSLLEGDDMLDRASESFDRVWSEYDRRKKAREDQKQ